MVPCHITDKYLVGQIKAYFTWLSLSSLTGT